MWAPKPLRGPGSSLVSSVRRCQVKRRVKLRWLWTGHSPTSETHRPTETQVLFLGDPNRWTDRCIRRGDHGGGLGRNFLVAAAAQVAAQCPEEATMALPFPQSFRLLSRRSVASTKHMRPVAAASLWSWNEHYRKKQLDSAGLAEANSQYAKISLDFCASDI